MNTTSTFISVLEVKAELDLRDVPSLVLTNESIGAQTGVKFAFELYSPSGAVVFLSTLASPSFTGTWSTFTIPNPMPVSMGSFEFGVYELVIKIETTDAGNFTYARTFDVSRPGGNSLGQNNNYGKGSLKFEVRCHTGKIFTEDKTNYFYRGTTGANTSKSITLQAPPDQTGVVPAATVGSGQSVMFDIPYSGKAFNLFLTSDNTYDISQNIFVKIRYKKTVTFDVFCNLDLSKVVCDIQKFEQAVCANPSKDNLEKLALINSKMNAVLVAKLQPGCSVNYAKLIEDIIDIGGFDCTCMSYSDPCVNFNVGASTCAVVITIPTIVPTQPVTIPFTNNVAAVGFEYELFLDGVSQGIVAIGSSPIILNTLPAGAHSIRVRGICSNDIRGVWSDLKPFVIPCDIVISNLQAIVNNQSGYVDFDFDFSGGTPTLYELVITDPTPTIMAPIQFSTKPHRVTGLTINGSYTYSIKARCGVSTWGSSANGGFVLSGFDIDLNPVAAFRAFWGELSNSQVLDVPTIEASTHFADFAYGANPIMDFTYQTTHKYLWVAIPKTQAVSIRWTGVDSNAYGSIGNLQSNSDIWQAPSSVGTSYYFYITTMPAIYTGGITFHNV